MDTNKRISVFNKARAQKTARDMGFNVNNNNNNPNTIIEEEVNNFM